MSARPRVAWWSPLPPNPSGIADYSAELLPHLARLWEIDLFVDGGKVEPSLAGEHRVVDALGADTVGRLSDYDAVVYQLGNSPAHESAYRALLEHPGLVVLHDVSLTHLVIEMTHGRGRTDRLFAEVRNQHGDAAAESMRRYFYINEPAPWDVAPLTAPLNRRAIEAARGVLVHSHFAAACVRAVRPGLPVEIVEQHALSMSGGATAPRERSAAEPLLFCTAGFLTPAKRIESVLAALARLPAEIPWRYRLVGATSPGLRLHGAIRDYGLEDRVERIGRVDKDELYRLLAEADVCIHLRRPTSGETSGMVQRVLASGCPVVVSDTGWFSELPDACAIKIPADDREVDALAAALASLALDPKRRASAARAAFDYAGRLDVASRARAYDAWLRRSIGARSGRRPTGLGAELAAAAAELDLPYEKLGLEDVAIELVGPRSTR